MEINKYINKADDCDRECSRVHSEMYTECWRNLCEMRETRRARDERGKDETERGREAGRERDGERPDLRRTGVESYLRL